MTHYYVFSHWINRIPVYDRTCGYADAATRIVADYLKSGKEGAFWVTTLPKHYWY